MKTNESHSGTENVTQAAWETILQFGYLFRNTRIPKSSATTLELLIKNALGLLHCQTVVWGAFEGAPHFMVGGENLLTEEETFQLIGNLQVPEESKELNTLLVNRMSDRSWTRNFPQVNRLAAVSVVDRKPIGWLIALNKTNSEEFTQLDAAILNNLAGFWEMQIRLGERCLDLHDMLVGLTRSLATALDSRDPITFGRSERVARIAMELGREIGMEGEELADLYLAGLLHDIGWIGLSDDLHRKQGIWSPEEMEQVKKHVFIGYGILSELRPFRNLLPGILYHHEHFDGSGYPDCLKGNSIPLMARILAVADGYENSSRPDPEGKTVQFDEVEKCLIEGAGKQWDPQIIDCFVQCRNKIHGIRQRGMGESLRQDLDDVLEKDQGVLVSPVF